MGTIAVENVGKAYKQYESRWGRFVEWSSPFNSSHHALKWVLRDINFTVQPGEAVGIIGVNGAGKSTLLKIITGTTFPTMGQVRTAGRVAALLELGIGFHPDFTGRQNAIMAGQLLGYTTAEILSLMKQIEAFAEIGEAIDEPVRTYSSGMQMRLAFSVATAVRPDILIVDEALSVGDAYFQHKSFDRIRAFRVEGTTLLIVSHDRAAIQAVCDRALLLNGGVLAKEGKPEEIMDYYNAVIAERRNETITQKLSETGKVQTISGTGEARVEEITLLNASGKPVDSVKVGELVELCVTVRTYAFTPRLVLGYAIKDRLGQYVFGTNTHHTGQALADVAPGQLIRYRIRFSMNFGPGSYSILTALHSGDTHLDDNYEWKELALLFNVDNVDKPVFVGNAWVPPTIEIERA